MGMPRKKRRTFCVHDAPIQPNRLLPTDPRQRLSQLICRAGSGIGSNGTPGYMRAPWVKRIHWPAKRDWAAAPAPRAATRLETETRWRETRAPGGRRAPWVKRTHWPAKRDGAAAPAPRAATRLETEPRCRETR